MSKWSIAPIQPQSPSVRDAATARTSRQTLADHFQEPGSLTLRLVTGDQETEIELPASAVASLLDVLDVIAEGHRVVVVPHQAELTTVEAAGLLNVSRPFLIKLLDSGAIPHRKVGAHRRITVEHLLAYKEQDDRERQSVLDQLVRDAQELDMGYPRQ